MSAYPQVHIRFESLG
jgi:hypothetical protein